MRLTNRQQAVLLKLRRSRRGRLTWIHLHDGIGRSRGTVDSLGVRGLVTVLWLRSNKVVQLTESGLIEGTRILSRWRKVVGQ